MVDFETNTCIDTAKVDDEERPLLLPSFGADSGYGTGSTVTCSNEHQRKSFRRKKSKILISNENDIYELNDLKDALEPLWRYSKSSHRVKSIPPFAPYRRFSRHRSFHLYWLNEFRHWWKSSRLLVRLAGLAIFYSYPEVQTALAVLNVTKHKDQSRAFKWMKKLGRGGEMSPFFKTVQPFTRSLRIIVAVWRWFEASKVRRFEVGVEEAFAFMGNRVSRIFARWFVDTIFLSIVFPVVILLVETGRMEKRRWGSGIFIVIFGILRACLPYIFSFQGSRVGRLITRLTFVEVYDKWKPVNGVEELNLEGPDSNEPDEINTNATLVGIARQIAILLHHDDVSNNIYKSRSKYLAMEGFTMVGCGSGGYAVYEYAGGPAPILLHATPYGPSICNVMPMYIILEYEHSVDMRGQWTDIMKQSGPPMVEGYCYQGAWFSPHHFAELKDKYDSELNNYNLACKQMCKKNYTDLTIPPTDLASLKSFIRIGRRQRKQNKDKHAFMELEKRVDKVASQIKRIVSKHSSGQYMTPTGVILYFEGLDCAGKSSTGNLLKASLEKAGFEVGFRQHNRPPSEKQKLNPWMDRFDRPEKGLNALVWDRGPAGDFVYGNLANSNVFIKKQRHQEFVDFDRLCEDEGTLFFKIMFVTTRDSIAKTLGKRLAHKVIARDLFVWLNSNHDAKQLDGLYEIEKHIDPTDFTAFNQYHNNLKKFIDFSLNTSSSPDNSPWIVVSTSDRFLARLRLLDEFERIFKLYVRKLRPRNLCGFSKSHLRSVYRKSLFQSFAETRLIRQLMLSFLMCLLAYTYLHHVDRI